MTKLQNQTNRHCEQSEAISSRLPRPNGLAMTNETGRSMVEMLGVLAVIGVLSITGISGYTTAMNKHRANEIADGATKRAMAVASQIQLGSTNPTLGEFGDSTANTIQGVEINTPTKVGENQFKLQLNWTDTTQKATLCKELKNVISTTGTGSASLIDTDCSRILFNNDMSVGVSNTNNRNSDGTACADGYAGTDCDSCDTDYGMHEGSCVACSTVGATGTHSSVLATGYTGCYCTSTQTWDGTQCKSAQKEFYLTAGNHYEAETACADVTYDNGGWHLASLSEFFDGLGSHPNCTYVPWDNDNESGNYYSGCTSYYSNLNLVSQDKDLSGFVWLAGCWTPNNKLGSTCTDNAYAWILLPEQFDSVISYDDREYSYSVLCTK